MGKVDCIVEKCKEEFDSGYDTGYGTGYDTGFDEGVLKTARAMLANGFSVKMVSKISDLSLKTVEDLKSELYSE